jgi:Transposase IS4
METASQSAPGAPIGSIGPILPSETLFEPPIPPPIGAIGPILPSESPVVPPQPAKKPPISKKRKRSLSDVMAEVPCVKDVKFDPLQIPHIPPQLRLPIGIDTDDAYALFSLFWPESMWNIITTNMNIYAVQKRLHFTAERQYPWHDTYIAEIKIFFGILIYIDLHKESEEA